MLSFSEKVCKNCKLKVPVSEFYFNRTKQRYFSECKKCNIKRSKSWNKTNEQRYKENCKKHKQENPELYAIYKKTDYENNKKSYQEYGKRYRKSQHGNGIRQALGRERELRKRHATPKWLTKEQRDEMKLFYINRPKGYHVDHIAPLKGKDICGLHVPWNLQYLTAAENLRKRNKLKK